MAELKATTIGKQAKSSIPAELFGEPFNESLVHEIAVAEIEPALAAEPGQHFHELPALVAQAPAALRIVETGQLVHHRIEIRGNMQPEMTEIVAGIDGDGELLRRQNTRQPVGELGAADAACQRQDHWMLRDAGPETGASSSA